MLNMSTIFPRMTALMFISYNLLLEILMLLVAAATLEQSAVIVAMLVLQLGLLYTQVSTLAFH